MLVDYAHTPDSLENVAARGARARPTGGVIVRVRLRRRSRPRQAAADGRDRRARCADLAIVTSDNPRSEDPEAIIAEILARGRRPDAPSRVVDRRAAIERARRRWRAPGDVVVIAGKGHEQGQEFGAGARCPSTTSPWRARRCAARVAA